MTAQKFDSKISNIVSIDKLKKIYSVLDNEERPFAADISKIGTSRRITVLTSNKDVEHFLSILKTNQVENIKIGKVHM